MALQAAKIPDMTYRKELLALSGESLLARESELRHLQKVGLSVGEFGARKAWNEDLISLGAIRGALEEIDQIKAGTQLPKITKSIKLEGSPTIAKPLPWNVGAPHFNGANRAGTTPQRDFLHPIPVRGSRQGLRFSVRGTLPAGVSLNTEKCILFGRPQAAGTWNFTLIAENDCGRAERPFTLIVGDSARGQTPLMGWTSWNAFTITINQKTISDSAHALVDRGFAARGYVYVNIDSTWQGLRDTSNGALQPNRKRFPNIKGLVDEIHGLGLKAGIYSTPMVIAWASDNNQIGYLPGSTSHPIDTRFPINHWGGCGVKRHEKEDAAQWAEWGFDYLKYDWTFCDIEHTRDMRAALDATSRDFTLCLCTDAQLDFIDEYPRYAQLVRGSSDTHDGWIDISRNCLYAIDKWAPKCGRGCWYDLDMLALGPIAIDRTKPPSYPLGKEYTNGLTRDEQIAHFALWAFLPTPLQLSWDLAFTDEFTADLVCNEELIALNQDSAPRSATTSTRMRDGSWLWVRDLADGSRAWLFFNIKDSESSFVYSLGQKAQLRDVLANADLGEADGVEIKLPAHAVRVIKSVKGK